VNGLLSKLYVIVSKREHDRLRTELNKNARTTDPLWDKLNPWTPLIMLKGIPILTREQVKFLKGVERKLKE